jgi:hypothetical protein
LSPEGCFVENTDISSKLEMLSFLARTEPEPGDLSSDRAEGLTA